MGCLERDADLTCMNEMNRREKDGKRHSHTAQREPLDCRERNTRGEIKPGPPLPVSMARAWDCPAQKERLLRHKSLCMG